MSTLLPIAALALFSAQAPLSVSASLSDTAVLPGDLVTLEINVISRVNEQIQIELPKIDGLSELSRSKSEGTSIQWTGGAQQITKEYTVTIELQADKSGKLTVPPIVARAGQQRAQSAPLALEVGQQQDTGQAATAQPGQIEPPAPGEERLFMRYQVDRAEAYVGQQIIVDLDVYAMQQLNFQIEDAPRPPTLDGFWQEIIDQPQRLTRRTESVRGRNYHVYRLWRVALFPLEAGERILPQVQLTFAVNRSIFGGGQRDRRRAPALKLEILPLPTEGKVSSFSAQNVGVYQLDAKLDAERVPAGKALVLTLAVSGRGNIKNVRLPELPPIDGFRVFAPTINDDVQIDGSGIHGTKRAEILLMPEKGGRLEIPSFEMTIFNPEEKRYQRLETGSRRVVVEGDPSAMTSATILPAEQRELDKPEDRRVARPSLRPLRYRSQLSEPKPLPWRDPLYAALFVVPPFVFFATRAGGRALAMWRRQTPESQRRARIKEAHARLSKARAAVNAGDTSAAYREMREALLDLGSERAGASLRGMTADEAKTALAARGASARALEGFAREMEAADYVSFAPQAIDRAALAGAAERWEQLFADLEEGAR